MTSADLMTSAVMYNGCYGGFEFSEEAIRLYNELSVCPMNAAISRTDPVMIQVVRELGERANTLYSQILLDDIPLRFIDHYLIHEYDGNESVHIQYDQYALQEIQNIMNNTALSQDEKIKKTQTVLIENQVLRL